MPIPLFQVSNLTWAQAKARVAAVAGGQDDADQLILAGYALEEAIRHWEAAKSWKYLETIAGGESAGAISGTTTFTPTLATDLRGLAVGMTATGTGILTDPTKISAIGASTVTLDQTCTNGDTTLTFSYELVSGTSRYNLPADWQDVYGVRLIGNNMRPLGLLDRRLYDMMRSDQTTPGTPVAYLLYETGDSGIIELVPANGVEDTMRITYYRRHYIPTDISTGSTSSDSVTLDFPLSYQTYLLAWGKVFYLNQKGGDANKLAFWTQMAERGLRTAKGDDEWHPDADHGFMPGNWDYRQNNPNDVTRYLEDW